MIETHPNLKKWIFIVICFSFFLKMIAGFYLKDSFLKRGNSHTPMNAIAANLLESGSYQITKGIPSIDYEPLYPGLMALSYKIVGMNWFGLTLFQGILFALSSWLLFLIATRLMDEKAGLIAALYHSFYPYLFSYSLSIYDTTLFVFLYLLLIQLLIRPTENLSKYAGVGGILGLTLLTRGSIIAFIPAVLFYIFMKSIKPFDLRMFFKHISVLFLFCLLAMSPWLVRNYLLTNKLIISTHGSYGLWQGNNEYSYHLLKNDISLDEVGRMKPAPAVFAKVPGRPASPRDAIKVANIYRDDAVSFIKNNPNQFLRLALLKFVKFWSWVRTPKSSSLEFGSNQSRELVFFLSYFPLLAFMPLGLFILMKKRKNEFYLIFGIIFFYTLAHMIAMGFTRARVPIDPLLMLFAGISLSAIIKLRFPNKNKADHL
jgi:4-amino-4-deoxy-L-arabinose transferase-like glycosyltransferase